MGSGYKFLELGCRDLNDLRKWAAGQPLIPGSSQSPSLKAQLPDPPEPGPLITLRKRNARTWVPLSCGEKKRAGNGKPGISSIQKAEARSSEKLKYKE